MRSLSIQEVGVAHVGVGGLGVGDSEEEGLDWEEVGWRSSWEEAG